MPSFFQAMKRVMQGKPIYDPIEPQQPPTMQQPGRVQPMPQPLPQAPHERPQMTHFGPKVLPRVYIEQRCECHNKGSHMECWAHIHNESRVAIELDKVRMLGVPRELDTRLRPGEKRQFLLYSGPIVHNANRHDCELQYKDETGDYFVSQHTIEFQKQSDGSLLIWRIRYERIKDIE